MNQKRVLAGVLISSMFFMGGCAGKRDFTKGVSEEDMKLLSSPSDKTLRLYKGLRITEKGFYPHCTLIPVGTILPDEACYENRYMTKVAPYSPVKKFNLKKFIDTIKNSDLKSKRNNLLYVKNKYPSFDVSSFNFEQIDTLSSKSTGLIDKQKILITKSPNYIRKITNPSKEILSLASSVCNAGSYGFWNSTKVKCIYNYPPSYSLFPGNNSSSGSYSGSSSGGGGSSSGGGYSDSSSSRSNNSNYVPGRGYYRPGQGHGYSSQY